MKAGKILLDMRKYDHGVLSLKPLESKEFLESMLKRQLRKFS